ncbi:response regulator [Paraglaciecola sp. MB-3u-78]|jgi:two-component system chemotaxis response regulator CheY|uniref:response regulator n=1 Tax=Paraglaciecola sp. MB-3u-78 TaxID=2058332 RepID=UPI000C31D6F0|nr:response regulator [Paraglaciecola sp. MB-3u-78]PKH00116.1 response regulator [Paraglaciecola sp. MB-3u-78]
MAQILIVDDSASMRNMVATTLKSAGHQVTDAPDGQAGLNKAKSSKFDVIVTDLNMPIMNGIDLVRNLRALANYKYTPILLLTTESSMDKKSEGKAAGATGWLVKPFNPDKLLATVARVIG